MPKVFETKKIPRRKILAVFAAAVLVILSAAVPTLAQAATTATSGSGNGLRISPVRTDLTINPGQSQTVDVFIQNVTSSTANLQVIVNDFTAGTDETGAPKILLNGQSAPSHGLKQFVAPIGNISVAPDQQKEVQAIITIPKNAAGGGYYGVVRFQPTSVGNGGNVSLAASVGSLILVTVPGNIIENTTIASFGVSQINTNNNGQPVEHNSSFFMSSGNLNAVLRFSNQGNVQEEPFGKIQLKSRSGKVLATYEINNTSPRGNVLPGSIRKFIVPLKKVGLFGKYTLVGNFGYGSKGQLLTAQTSFYIIPLWLILVAILVIVLIVLAIIFLPRAVRAYNRRILRRAGRR